MSFSGLILTNAGRNKMAAAVSERNALQFTKIQLGDASYNGSYKSKTQLSSMVMELPITRVQRENGEVLIECDWNSKQAPRAFYLREIGIIGNGVLCYYDNARDGDAEFIDPESEVVLKQKRFRFKISVTDDMEVVTMIPSGLYALKEELDANIQELEEEINGKVDKTGDTSEATVTFTQASGRANISAGEKLSVIFGKIARWLADIKTVALTGNYNDLANKPENATQSAQGLMSANDKTKLDGIASGANAYSLPAASTTVRGGVKTGYAANGKNYPVQLSNEQMYVNVPWTNTWRGVQNNLTSDSTAESLSAAQGKALKTLVDEKAALNHTHSYLPLSGGTITGDLKANGKITSGTSSAPGEKATAFGEACYAPGNVAFAAGGESYAMGIGTVAIGCGCAGRGNYGVALGYNTEASYFQFVYGSCNKSSNGPSSQGAKSGDAFIIGNGTSTTNRSNAFRVTGAGATYACSAFNSSGADYAEFFEWEDGNVETEDRRGYFVTLSGDKIKLAEPGDYILGVVSARPTVIGNSDEGWNGRYITDNFGSYIEETYEYDESSVDENGEKTIIRKTGITWKENPDYDPEMTYIQRADRAEWDAVGMIGVLPVRDDGSCKVNGYCTVAEGGIATACSCSTSSDVYRVIERSGDNVVKIVVK